MIPTGDGDDNGAYDDIRNKLWQAQRQIEELNGWIAYFRYNEPDWPAVANALEMLPGQDAKEHILRMVLDIQQSRKEQAVEIERLRRALEETLVYMEAWRADWSKCRNQHIPIDRIKKSLSAAPAGERVVTDPIGELEALIDANGAIAIWKGSWAEHVPDKGGKPCVEICKMDEDGQESTGEVVTSGGSLKEAMEFYRTAPRSGEV